MDDGTRACNRAHLPQEMLLNQIRRIGTEVLPRLQVDRITVVPHAQDDDALLRGLLRRLRILAGLLHIGFHVHHVHLPARSFLRGGRQTRSRPQH